MLFYCEACLYHKVANRAKKNTAFYIQY